MQLQPGHLGCHLPPAANLRKLSWRRPEPSSALSALPQLKQSSRNPSCYLFQRVSKPSPTYRLTEWAHLPPADDRRQTLFTACRQRLKRKDWRNTQFLCLNQLGLYPQILTPTPPSCEQLFIPPWDKSPPNSHHTSYQENVTIPAEKPFTSYPCLHSPADIQIFTVGSVRDGIEDGGAGMVVLSQDLVLV